MKNRYAFLIIALMFVLSGVAGFGGGYLAGSLADHPPAPYEMVSPPGTGGAPDWDAERLNAYIDSYLASLDASSVSLDYAHLLNSAGSAAAPAQLTIPEVAAAASNSVVEIYTETVSNSGRMRQFITEGAGSGVIVSADGYIVTNNHVIEGSSKITVRLTNGTDHEATLVGRDSSTDLAVIKINAAGLQPAVYGNSGNIVVGELAIAIGNPLGKLGGSVSEGIISALSRNIEIDGHMMTLLQTTAAVNPGNSGGGLFNSRGELIGVVNAKSSGSDIEGLGFAIPINIVESITGSLIEHGFVPGRIDFGVALIDILDPITAMMYRVQTMGVYVSQADQDLQLRAGDRILSINGTAIRSTADVNELLGSLNVGDILTIAVSRSGSNITVQHTLRQAKS